MTFKFSSRSEHHNRSIHPDLQRVFRRALSMAVLDFGVLDGHRGEARQNQYFAEGTSKVQWPDGNHNEYPSRAGDLIPYVEGIDMFDPRSIKYWYQLAGIVLAAAAAEGVDIRWGGDWDSDTNMDDQTFNDLGHFELARKENA